GGPLGDSKEEDEESQQQVNSAGQIVNQQRAYQGTVTVSGQLGEGAALMQTDDLTDLQFTWVTFDAEPTAGQVDVDANGYFEDELPRNKPFGAFIRSKSSNSVVATLVIGATEGDTRDREQATFALDSAL